LFLEFNVDYVDGVVGDVGGDIFANSFVAEDCHASGVVGAVSAGC
jgi:hypothetical protein